MPQRWYEVHLLSSRFVHSWFGDPLSHPDMILRSRHASLVHVVGYPECTGSPVSSILVHFQKGKTHQSSVNIPPSRDIVTKRAPLSTSPYTPATAVDVFASISLSVFFRFVQCRRYVLVLRRGLQVRRGRRRFRHGGAIR